MRKSVCIAMAIFFTFGMNSCKDKNSKTANEPNEKGDSTEVTNNLIYGTLGEGTGMSCMEFVTNQGDTLILNKDDEDTGKQAVILGSIVNYTDTFAFMINADSTSVTYAINVSQLSKDWTNDTNNISFLANGNLTSDFKKDYNSWELCNNALVLKGENLSDTAQVVQLGLDSLYLSINNEMLKFKIK